jgi:hypothetical protein
MFSLEMCHMYVVAKARREREGSESGLIPISTRKVLPKAPSTNHSKERSVDPQVLYRELALARSIGYRGMR